ncbi:MAG: hypothetical protein LBK66_05285 [Spirochaetaceae bacterium]|jgi:hypothetical protein|nr:hypothetical protein [Spirochaetaceae bacterium]
MKNLFKRALWALTGIGIFALISAVFTLAVMFLWNWLLPVIFDLPKINYIQAAGLFLLTRILFSGIGITGGGFGHGRNRHEKFLFGNDPRRNNPFREKWLNMSEEERNDFLKHHHNIFR